MPHDTHLPPESPHNAIMPRATQAPPGLTPQLHASPPPPDPRATTFDPLRPKRTERELVTYRPASPELGFGLRRAPLAAADLSRPGPPTRTPEDLDRTAAAIHARTASGPGPTTAPLAAPLRAGPQPPDLTSRFTPSAPLRR